MTLYSSLQANDYFCRLHWKWVHGFGCVKILETYFRGMVYFTRCYRIGCNGFSGGILCCLIFCIGLFCIQTNGRDWIRGKSRTMKTRHQGYGMNNSLGKNWILLRGLARESAHWGNFVPLLQATFPDAKITTLDLPGTGRFYRDESPSTIEAIAETVRLHALELGLLQQPVTVLALSLGGMVAWEWLQNHPEDSCGAALISTSFAGLNPFYQRLRWQSYGKFFALLMQRDLYKRELAIIQLVNNSRERDGQIAQDWEQIQKERPINLKNMYHQMLAAATYQPSPTKPTQPVLLLNAKGDRLVAPACSEAIQKKWHLELRTHPWAGHDLTVDDGAWVALQLKNWVAQN